ncbi:MAG: response regulator [Opitutae bacterium]|nr:response regulator [Opitutae bacterium]
MSKPRILIVEDEAIVAMDIRSRLRLLGYEVTGAAATAEKAFELIAAGAPELVLMDIRLQGGMDGVAAADVVRNRFRLPVVFLTAYAEDATVDRAKRVEPFGYILKPFEDRELKTAIEMALYKHGAEKEIRRLTGIYAFLSQVNQTIVRSTSREELFATICRIAGEYGHFKMAWIGWLDPATQSVQPVAQWGDTQGYLAQIAVSAANEPPGRGPAGAAGAAVREERPIVVNDFAIEPRVQPWREAAEASGFRSAAGFPIRDQGRVCGVLTVYAAEKDFFQAKEIQLLEEVTVDITYALEKLEAEAQRRRAEAAREESEQRYRRLLASTTDYIYTVRVENGRAIETIHGPGCEAITGYGIEDFRADSNLWYHMIHPDDRAAVVEHAARVRAGHPVPPLTHRIWHKDGSLRWLRDTMVVRRDASGTVVAYDGLISDITARKSAEENLRASETLLRAALESTADGILVVDENGRVTHANSRFADLWRIPGELLKARDDGRLLQSVLDQLAEPEAFLAKVRELYQSSQESFDTLQFKDGRVYERYSCPLVLDNRMHGRVWSFRDVTERQQAAENLARQKQILETASEAAHVALWAWDMSTGALEWTDVIDQMLGESPGAFPRTMAAWETAMHPEDRSRVLAALEAHLQKNARYEVEYRVRRKDGTYLWWHDAGVCRRDASGAPYDMFGACTDITARKQSEEARARLESHLRQAQKMEAVGTLAGGIAHDFNNILGAIVCFTELAKEDTQDREEVQDALDNVLKGTDRAKDLVRQILTFSRQTKQERKPLAVHFVVKEALKLLRSTLPASIEIIPHLPAAAPLALADPTQIHQIMMNLCTNAAHAMRNTNGVLEVTLEPFVADEEFTHQHPDMVAGLYLKLSVSDTGHGMDEETLKHIFDPFFTTKGPGEGTGLGLAVVHGIVKDHEGTIDVYSQPGKGTVFHLYFPALAAQEALPGTPLPSAPHGHGERILVVDNEPVLCIGAERILKRLGYQPTAVTDPKRALRLFFNEPQAFQLVLTDLSMPGLSGIDLATAILQMRPDLPVILTTGFNGSITMEDIHNVGIREMLLKPLSTALLGQAIARHLPPPAPGLSASTGAQPQLSS